MDSDDSSSDERETSMNNNDKRIYHRHSNHQIQRLEAYFRECPHPDDTQRRKLGEELQLKPKQIKFWFQNKRTQAKAQNERADNTALKTENAKISMENEAMKEALKSVLCPPCGGPRTGGEERERSLQKLRLENAFLKEEYEKASGQRAIHGGHSRTSVNALPYLHDPPSYASGSNISRHISYGSSPNHVPQPPSMPRGPYTRENINMTQLPQPQPQPQLQHFPPLSQMEKLMMSEMAAKAVAEVLRLIRVEEPMWIRSSIDGRLVIDQETYDKFFNKVNHFKSSNARVESSKEGVILQVEAINLIDMLLDTEKWARLFPTIVNEAKTIHLLESSKLIYEQLHILSPLVPPREFMILRSCKKVEADLWVIADVSYNLPYVDFEFGAPTCAKRPSGCLIQALPDGRSKVTWMEHVEVDDKVRTHKLYRDLLCGGSGFGARRWTTTLERMCERLSLSSLSVFPTTDHGGVVKTIVGRRSIMTLGESMSKNFAWILKMSKKADFAQQPTTNNSGVRISVRTSTVAGQPPGLIFCAGSSLCLPIPPLQVYNFLSNMDLRHQWDVLCHGNPVSEVARFATGTDRKNSVTILQPSTSTGTATRETSELMIMQDGFIDALGGMIVYAPVDLNTAYAAISGQVDPTSLPILPSGFMISRDGRPSAAELASGRDYSMTLLTVAFQILVSGPGYAEEDHMRESGATVHSLVSSTVQRIKAMLNCDDAQ